jgi:hypothetical protein
MTVHAFLQTIGLISAVAGILLAVWPAPARGQEQRFKLGVSLIVLGALLQFAASQRGDERG